ncbi:serine/threonine protein kinase [Ceratobasidium sp. 423]|nr:serine/threonine protein kinase [Ceratobasidium sp. 423]
MEFSNWAHTDNISSFGSVKLLGTCSGKVLQAFTGHELDITPTQYIWSWSPLLAQLLLLSQDFPNWSGILLNYCHTLCFDDKLDYSYLHKLFCKLFICEGYQYDYVFDWSVHPPSLN